MALRFVAVLSILCFTLITICPSVGMAGGPPVAAPVCAPPVCAPPVCAPPSCGPTGGPFALLGGLLGVCTNMCGAVIGLPSAVMGGLLAPPPPKRCAPPVCAPVVCAPPSCAPPVCGPPVCGPPVCMPTTCAPPVCMPAPITKCKPFPGVFNQIRPTVRYQADPNFVPASYVPTVAYPVTQSPVELPDQLSVVHYFLDAPFKLVSGTLQGSGIYNVSFAGDSKDLKRLSENLW